LDFHSDHSTLADADHSTLAGHSKKEEEEEEEEEKILVPEGPEAEDDQRVAVRFRYRMSYSVRGIPRAGGHRES
jgi:hypothetical protein